MTAAHDRPAWKINAPSSWPKSFAPRAAARLSCRRGWWLKQQIWSSVGLMAYVTSIYLYLLLRTIHPIIRGILYQSVPWVLFTSVSRKKEYAMSPGLIHHSHLTWTARRWKMMRSQRREWNKWSWHLGCGWTLWRVSKSASLEHRFDKIFLPQGWIGNFIIPTYFHHHIEGFETTGPR